MKILIVTQYFWPESFRINDLVSSLAERGVDVDVLTGQPNYPEGKTYSGYKAWHCQKQEWNGVRIFRLPIMPRGEQSALRLIANYLSFVISGVALAPWLLRKRRYDAVFVYGTSPILQAIPAIFIGWLKKSPVVLWVQDLWPESLEATGYIRNKSILKVVEKIVRFIYQRTDILLVQSRAFEKFVGVLAPGKLIRYYPNSVEAMFCQPPVVSLPEVKALDSGFSIVFAGNVGAAQAVDVIVEAATLLKDHTDIRFVVFGNGSRWQWMCEESKARGLNNIHFPGRFPIDTMPGLMAKASALLVTLTDKPIFAATVPNKVQAYMAAGRPILACLNGEGARLVVEAGAGIAVAAEDARALADAIVKLYEMKPEERSQLGTNGREYYKNNFDHERLVDQLVEQLKQVAKSRGRNQ
jgi:glycosyltransferase involved in cell wall biosynthesis